VLVPKPGSEHATGLRLALPHPGAQQAAHLKIIRIKQADKFFCSVAFPGREMMEIKGRRMEW
jgi:hypothetical protein